MKGDSHLIAEIMRSADALNTLLGQASDAGIEFNVWPYDITIATDKAKRVVLRITNFRRVIDITSPAE